jgi:2,3-bisphosphoglycerate-independent phosphoglycerate mutase
VPCAQAARTAAIVNHLSDRMRARLRGHPLNEARAAAGKNVANVLLLRGAGVRVDLPGFEARHGLRACIVAPTKVLGGARRIGMQMTGSEARQWSIWFHASRTLRCMWLHN